MRGGFVVVLVSTAVLTVASVADSANSPVSENETVSPGWKPVNWSVAEPPAEIVTVPPPT